MFEWLDRRSDVYTAAAYGKTIARESIATLKGLFAWRHFTHWRNFGVIAHDDF